MRARKGLLTHTCPESFKLDLNAFRVASRKAPSAFVHWFVLRWWWCRLVLRSLHSVGTPCTSLSGCCLFVSCSHGASMPTRVSF